MNPKHPVTTRTVSPALFCVSFSSSSSSEAAKAAKAAKRGHLLLLFLSLHTEERLVSPPKRKTTGLKGMHLECILGKVATFPLTCAKYCEENDDQKRKTKKGLIGDSARGVPSSLPLLSSRSIRGGKGGGKGGKHRSEIISPFPTRKRFDDITERNKRHEYYSFPDQNNSKTKANERKRRRRQLPMGPRCKRAR